MSDLMSGSSTWAAGTPDTASTLENGVNEKRAEHINGPAAAIVAMQGKLGSAAGLLGTKTNLAERLNVSIREDGTLTSAEPGDICMSARTAKTGWLLCDGAAVSRSVYADLFLAIGTKYGAGNGSTTFNVPNMSERVPMGAGTGAGLGSSGLQGTTPNGSAGPGRDLGDWFGENTHLLTDDESGLPLHAHGIAAFNINSSAGNDIGASAETAGAKTLSTNNQGGTNASQAHNNLQPSLVVNFFIKT